MLGHTSWATSRYRVAVKVFGESTLLRRRRRCPYESCVTAHSSSTAHAPRLHHRSRTSPNPLARQPLDTYPWPQRRPEVFNWLEGAIQTAVQQLDKAPFLELIYPDRTDTKCVIHSIADSVVQLPQLWQGVAEHLSGSQPDVLLLLHQLPPEPDTVRSEQTELWPTEDMFTGMAAHQALNQSRLKYCSMLLRDGIAEGVMAGKVGDCCDGEAQAEVLPFDKQRHAQTKWDQQQPASHDSGKYSLHNSQLVDFWGVVVQSRYRSDAEGAYFLKTVRNANPVECQCTHYSLMRIGRGDSKQAVSWLLSK